MASKQLHSSDCQACCEGKQATHECVECAQALCKTCQQSHGDSDPSKIHTLQPLAVPTPRPRAVADGNCHLHMNQPHMLFCCQCETPICMMCKLTTHAEHKTEDLMDTGKRARVELNEELQILAKQEQLLRAFLIKSQDFREDLQRERQGVEEKMLDRVQELRQMVDRAHAEALESVAVTTEKALKEVKEMAVPVEERHAALDAKLKNVRKVIEEGADSQVVALLTQIREEKAGRKHVQQVLLERCTVKYEYRVRAVKYVNMLAFIGSAMDGPVMEARAAGTDNLEVFVRPSSLSSEESLTFRRGKVSQSSRSAPVEIHYSKNPKSTLLAIHLMSTDDDFWLSFNPGGNVQLFGLFDDDGHMKEMHSEDIPSMNLLLTCDGDTVLSMTNGRWVRPGKEKGSVDGFENWAGISVSKSSTPYLLKQNSIFRQISDALPPEIDATAAYTIEGVAMTFFDVSEDGSFVAGVVGSIVQVFDKLQGTAALRSYANYVKDDGSASDVCFCRMDGKEVLLVAYVALHTVHIVDHRDGCCFIRTLETERHPLHAPCLLATNHHGRVWVGCNGGKVVLFDV